MTEKELKKMSRRELLVLMLELTREMDRLKEALGDAEEKLRDRSIDVEKAGSVAEAALKLSGVFEAAETAAKDYLENIKSLSERQDRISERVILEAKDAADRIIADAEAYSRKTRAEADLYYKSIKEKADRLSDAE